MRRSLDRHLARVFVRPPKDRPRRRIFVRAFVARARRPCYPASRAGRRRCPTTAPESCVPRQNHHQQHCQTDREPRAPTSAAHPQLRTTRRTTPRHSSQRQGNCMNCSFGRNLQSRPVTGNMSTLQATAHASNPSSRARDRCFAKLSSRKLRAPQLRAAHMARVTTISATATQEIDRLKRHDRRRSYE